MNIDFSSDFHIWEYDKNCALSAWILDFSNRVHHNLSARLWTLFNSLILHELFLLKTV
jgi:hypothetical protein